MNVSQCTLIKPLSCTAETPLPEVARILREYQQRRILVVDTNESPIGIISTTDMNNRVIAENKDAAKLAAQDVMTQPLHLVCDLNDDLNEVYHKMIQKTSYYCPVTQNGKLYGILTYGEMVRCLQHLLHHG
ncbi:MAG TPA: CBS domain-containing protein [Candidatus Nanoarchaeia archaeon]|nr:CBS domain-containing protein [Candidatus Nanoarchaeia archaeon]